MNDTPEEMNPLCSIVVVLSKLSKIMGDDGDEGSSYQFSSDFWSYLLFFLYVFNNVHGDTVSHMSLCYFCYINQLFFFFFLYICSSNFQVTHFTLWWLIWYFVNGEKRRRHPHSSFIRTVFQTYCMGEGGIWHSGVLQP